MNSGAAGYIKKGIQSAEQAVAEDKVDNYEAAEQHYMTTVDWLMQAIKCEYKPMNEQMKQSLQLKVEAYVKRVDQIRDFLKNSPVENETAMCPACDQGKSRYSENPSGKRMIQKFEGAIVIVSTVTFDDIIGLEHAIETLKEVASLPTQFPQLSQGTSERKLWSSILLYGPSGTGKSYLAQAFATECKRTFISVTSSDILSYRIADSEEAVKYLFEVAHTRQPCVVFLDEIDGFCSRRSDAESESSRRAKVELLFQMQGGGRDNSDVFVLAATNTPWLLDTTIQRRFEKHVYISLPNVKEREAMFKMHLGINTFHTIREPEWLELAQKTENNSGADIADVCREALHSSIRQLLTATHFKRVTNPDTDGPPQLWLSCSPDEMDAEPLKIDEIKSDELCQPPVTMSDMMAALATKKSTVNEADLLLLKQFEQEYGQ